MVSAHGTVQTTRPARYAKQLTSHFGAKMETTWDGEHGTIVFRGQGQDAEDPKKAFDGEVTVAVTADENAGILTFDLSGKEDLIPRFAGVIERHLVRFGSAENLQIDWA